MRVILFFSIILSIFVSTTFSSLSTDARPDLWSDYVKLHSETLDNFLETDKRIVEKIKEGDREDDHSDVELITRVGTYQVTLRKAAALSGYVIHDNPEHPSGITFGIGWTEEPDSPYRKIHINGVVTQIKQKKSQPFFDGHIRDFVRIAQLLSSEQTCSDTATVVFLNKLNVMCDKKIDGTTQKLTENQRNLKFTHAEAQDFSFLVYEQFRNNPSANEEKSISLSLSLMNPNDTIPPAPHRLDPLLLTLTLGKIAAETCTYYYRGVVAKKQRNGAPLLYPIGILERAFQQFSAQQSAPPGAVPLTLDVTGILETTIAQEVGKFIMSKVEKSLSLTLRLFLYQFIQENSVLWDTDELKKAPQFNEYFKLLAIVQPQGLKFTDIPTYQALTVNSILINPLEVIGGLFHQLRSLHIMGCRAVNSQFLSYLSNLPHLSEFTYANCRLDSLRDLCKSLKKNPHLVALDISDNGLVDCSHLTSLQQLRLLNVSGNPLHSSDFLTSMTHLQSLNLERTLVVNTDLLDSFPDDFECVTSSSGVVSGVCKPNSVFFRKLHASLFRGEKPQPDIVELAKHEVRRAHRLQGLSQVEMITFLSKLAPPQNLFGLKSKISIMQMTTLRRAPVSSVQGLYQQADIRSVEIQGMLTALQPPYKRLKAALQRVFASYGEFYKMLLELPEDTQNHLLRKATLYVLDDQQPWEIPLERAYELTSLLYKKRQDFPEPYSLGIPDSREHMINGFRLTTIYSPQLQTLSRHLFTQILHTILGTERDIIAGYPLRLTNVKLFTLTKPLKSSTGNLADYFAESVNANDVGSFQDSDNQSSYFVLAHPTFAGIPLSSFVKDQGLWDSLDLDAYCRLTLNFLLQNRWNLPLENFHVVNGEGRIIFEEDMTKVSTDTEAVVNPLLLLPLMKKPIPVTTQNYYASILPTFKSLLILAACQHVQQAYADHITEDETPYISFGFMPGAIRGVRKNLGKVQRLFGSGQSVTLLNVFAELYPDEFTRYNQTLEQHDNMPLQVYETLKTQNSNITIEDQHRKQTHTLPDEARDMLGGLLSQHMGKVEAVAVLDLLAEHFWFLAPECQNLQAPELWNYQYEQNATEKARKFVFMVRYQLYEFGLSPKDIDLDYRRDLSEGLLLKLDISGRPIGRDQFNRVLQFPSLIRLKLVSGGITNGIGLNGLSSIHNLQQLDLSNNSIKYLDFLRNLTRLTHLNLATNQLDIKSGLDVLGTLRSMVWLKLSGNPIEQCTFCLGLPALRQLYLNETSLKKVIDFSKLTNLTLLNLENNGLKGTLKTQLRPENVYISGNPHLKIHPME